MDEKKLLAFKNDVAWRTIMAVTTLCPVTVLLEVFSGAGVSLLFALLMFAGLFVYWITMIIWSLITQRWRSMLLIVGVGCFEVCLAWFGVQNNDGIHF